MSQIVRPTFDVETKRKQIMNDINREYESYLQQNAHTHIQNKKYSSRNILLVGLSKSGKTTLRHILMNPRYISKELTLPSLPNMEIKCESITCTELPFITLNIVEIPSHMIEENSDLFIINKTCIELGITNFHLICFCTSMITGIDGLTIKLFTRLIQHFGEDQLRHNLCFIITRCEKKNDEQRKNLCNEFLNDTDFAQLTKNQIDRIYFSGALDPDDYEKANDVLYYEFDMVYNYRKKLLELMMSDIKPIHMSLERPSLSSISRYDYQTNFDEYDSYQLNSVFQPTSQTKISKSKQYNIVRQTEPSSVEYHQQNNYSIPYSYDEPAKQSNCCCCQ